MTPRITLILALVSLAVWVALIPVKQMPSGWPNGLYALGILLLVRWVVERGVRA